MNFAFIEVNRMALSRDAAGFPRAVLSWKKFTGRGD
jgi:hypothetical protein